MIGGGVEVHDETQALHRRALVLDLHNDLLTKLVLRGGNFGKRHGAQWFYDPLAFDIDLPKLREGGVDGLGCLLFAGFGLMAKKRFWAQLDRFQALLATHPELVQVRGSEELRRAKAEGRIALWLGVEGALPVEDDLAVVERLRDAGVLFFGPCWNKTNRAGTSSADRRGGGLSALGHQLVERLDHHGIAVDVSHANARTVDDLLRASKAPVFSSHSGCSAVYPHHRNLSDDQLRQMADRGGVVGIIFASNYLGGTFSASLETLACHIEHAARVGGDAFVALGSDFDGFVPLVRGMRDVADLPRLSEVLRRRGWSDRRLEMLLGGNFLCYLDRHAAALSA
ncbi:MAG: dipeptidase [Polyangia bacterium]